jgi:Ribosomal protein L7/L12 C-terminal domain
MARHGGSAAEGSKDISADVLGNGRRRQNNYVAAAIQPERGRTFILGTGTRVVARSPAARAGEAIPLDSDECKAPAATARFAHLLMNTQFVIPNEAKNPRVACGREHGCFTSFGMTGKGKAVHLLPPRKPRNGLLRRLAMTGQAMPSVISRFETACRAMLFRGKAFMPTPLSDEALKSLTEALRQGRKIEAIKLYRGFTGLGLKEAKDGIEELEASLRTKFPDQFPAAPKGKGCAGGVAVLCLGFAVLAYSLLRR